MSKKAYIFCPETISDAEVDLVESFLRKREERDAFLWHANWDEYKRFLEETVKTGDVIAVIRVRVCDDKKRRLMMEHVLLQDFMQKMEVFGVLVRMVSRRMGQRD